MKYPSTKTVDQIDEYFGTSVADPYRWLEQDVRNAPDVREWVDAQNKVTSKYLGKLPGREGLAKRLAALWNFERYSVPHRVGSRWFQYRNDGLQNHAVLFVAPGPDGPWETLFDPNEWSEDGTEALGGVSVSSDGRYAAYAIQQGGSDWRTWRVRDLDTGQDLQDELQRLKFTGVSWEGNGEGFFYSKYDAPREGDEFTGLNLNNRIMYHRLGTAQQDDVEVYWRPEHPDWNYATEVTEDGRYLLIYVSVGTDDRYRLYLKDLHHRYAAPTPLVDEFEHSYGYIDNDGPIFFLRTNRDAPRGRVIAMDVRQPAPEHWCEVIPESDAVLEQVSLVGNQFICCYMRDVKSQVEIYAADGRHVRSLELPGVGTAHGFEGKRGDTSTWFGFSSFAIPPSVYRYDLVTGESSVHFRPKVDIDPDAYLTEQVFFTSKDGTEVPMFITRRRDITLDGDHAAILYGYGGFNIPLQPNFSISRIAWLELGGIYVVANLRGGGEYGREWHEGGKKLHKQNVFDDCLCAAEHLIAKGYTRADRLAVQGGSNGGLLVGAVMTQQPQLFAAALPAVGVMDMLRFDAFTAGRYWTDDYGSASDSKDMFDYLHDYSPYHNLVDGTKYPATLITTADTDDRVVPGHSFKFAARLQAAQGGKAPTLIRIETRAGHGAGKPTWMLIEELADVYAFTARHTGLEIVD